MRFVSNARRWLVFATSVTLLAGACGDSDSSDTQAPTSLRQNQTTQSQVETSQQSVETTVVVESTTTTVATTVAPTTSEDPGTTEVPVIVEPARLIDDMFGSYGPMSTDGSSPDGSGCSPGSDELPDGLWFVALVDVDEESVDLDLMCRFSGDAAFARDDYLGGDYLYLNDAPKIRTSSFNPEARVWLLANPGFPDSQEALLPGEVAGTIIGREYPPWVWALVENGLVRELWEPWDS